MVLCIQIVHLQQAYFNAIGGSRPSSESKALPFMAEDTGIFDAIAHANVFILLSNLGTADLLYNFRLVCSKSVRFLPIARLVEL